MNNETPHSVPPVSASNGPRAKARAIFAYRGDAPKGWPLRTWLVVLALAWLAARLFANIDPFWTMVPPAVALSLLVSLARAGLRERRLPRAPSAEPALACVALLALTWVALGYVYRFRLPFDTGDHQVMAAKAELFARGLLRGRWIHWSHLFQGGDTLTDLYPIFFNFLTAIAYAFVPKGAVSFMAVYSGLVVFGWWLRGAAAYAVCRRFASPLPSALAALVALFDTGADVSDGVWNGAFYWGMIHNNIALSIGLFATATQVDLCRRVTTKGIVLCALLCAAAAFAHPLGLLYVVVTTAGLALASLLYGKRLRRPTWALVASCIGLLLAAVWILPYTYALKTLGFNGAVPGIDYHELGTGFFNGRAPTSSFGALVGLGLLAMVVAITSGRPLLVAAGVNALLFLLLGLTPFVVESRLAVYFPSFLDGQQRRMLTVVKVAVLPCAAYTVGLALAHLSRVRATLAPRAVLARAVVLGLLLYGPGRALVWGGQELLETLQAQNPKGPSGPRAGRSATNPDQEAAFAWIKARRTADASLTPWRVTIFDRYPNSAFIHSTWVEGLYTGAPVVDFGWESAVFIGIRPREMTAQGFTDWNIRYAIGRSATPPFAGLTERFTAGAYHVWELDSYDDHFVTAPAGQAVTNLAFGDDTISFDVAGAPPEGADVQVRCAWFPRWRAEQGGRDVVLKRAAPHEGAKPRQEQLRVHVSDGHVVLHCDRAMPRFAAGLLITLSGGIGLAFVIARERRQRIEEGVAKLCARVATLGARVRILARAKPWIAVAAATVPIGLLAVLAVFRGSTVLLSPPIEGGPGLDLSAVDAKGHALMCNGRFWSGTYECHSDEPTTHELTVDHWVGVTPVLDDAGEYATEWPGLRVTILRPQTAATLRYPKVELAHKKLAIDYTTNGRINLEVVVDGGRSQTFVLEGAGRQLVPVGAAVSNVAGVDVRISAISANASLAFRGLTQ